MVIKYLDNSVWGEKKEVNNLCVFTWQTKGIKLKTHTNLSSKLHTELLMA